MNNLFNQIKSLKIVNVLRNIKLKYELLMHKRSKERDGYLVISLIDEIARKNGIDIWIEWGTLLGFLREGALIGHDYDIDFSTYRLEDEIYNKFRSDLQEKGFKIIRQFQYENNIISETYEYEGVSTDIDYCVVVDGKWENYEYDLGKSVVINKEKNKFYYQNMDLLIYRNDSFEIQRGKFRNGVECNVPGNIESHIKYLYGDNWKTPIKDFDCRELNNYELIEGEPRLSGWRAV